MIPFISGILLIEKKKDKRSFVMHLENRIHTSSLNQPTKEMVQTNDEKNQKSFSLVKNQGRHKASKPTLWFTRPLWSRKKSAGWMPWH